MSDLRVNSVTLALLNELKEELAPDDSAYPELIDSVIRTTQESLKNEIGTRSEHTNLGVAKEPYRSHLKDLFRFILVEELETRHANT